MPPRVTRLVPILLLGCTALPPAPDPPRISSAEAAAIASDEAAWAPASEDPGWAPPLEVVGETAEGELEVLGRILPPPAERPAGRWGIRARYLTPGLVARLRADPVPGLWLTRATDEDLAHVAALTSLTWLSIAGEEVSDRGLEHVRGLVKLQALELGDWPGCPRITSAGLVHLAGLRSLRRLTLRGTSAGGRGLAQLAGLPDLVHLDLERTPLDARGVDQLVQLTGLKRLSVEWNGLGDAELARLIVLQGLTDLDASMCPVTDAGLLHLADGLPSLERLTLRGCKNITDAGVEHLSRIRGLTRVDLSGCAGVTNASLESLARLPRLAELGVADTALGAHALAPLVRMGALRSLDIGPGGVSDLALLPPTLERLTVHGAGEWAEAIPALPALRTLTLTGAALDPSRFPALERLSLSGSGGFEACGQARHPGLRRLEISSWYGSLDDTGLASLTRLSGLTHLDLRGTKVTDAGLRSLEGLRQLRSLVVAECKQVTVEGIEWLEEHLPGCAVLDESALDYERIHHLNGHELARLVRLERRLTRLDLWSDELTDADLEHLRWLPRLQKLSLEGSRLSDAGMTPVGSLLELEELDLSTCERLTSLGVSRLGRLGSLEKLWLGPRAAVDDAALVHLSSLTSLRMLDLDGCTLLTDRGIDRLGSLTRLTRLDLRGCARITDAALPGLARLSRLETLDLLDCPRLTTPAVDELGEALPGCTIAFTDPDTAFASADEVREAFAGDPSWCSIGGSVYHSGTVDEASRGLLRVQESPLWFFGKGEPRHPAAIPVERDTVRLGLSAEVAREGGLELVLELTSKIPVARWVEHRYTNVLPFLFAMAVDGRSVVRAQRGFGRQGGMPGTVSLIRGAAGGTRSWRVRVDVASLVDAAGLGADPARVALLAVFSDSQHDGLWRPWDGQAPREAGVLVRSAPVLLDWDGSALEPP